MPPRNLLRFAVVSAMCSLGLGACTVGPDFVRPTTPWLAGYTTETVVVIALLVAMALAAIAIIAAKVLAKANGLNLG